MGLQASIQRPFAGVAEWGMAEVVGKRQGLGQILIEAQLPGQRPRNLRHFQRVSEPGAIMIALMEHENLRLVLQAAERGGMDDPVAIAPERTSGPARRLYELPPPAAIGGAGIDRARGGHSDRHGVFISQGFDSAPRRT